MRQVYQSLRVWTKHVIVEVPPRSDEARISTMEEVEETDDSHVETTGIQEDE